MSIQKIGFIGLGLIGGSLVKTIHRIHPHIKMIAISGRESTIEQAFTQGLIENDKPITLSALSDCDYIFLCTPVQQNQNYLKELKSILKPGGIITDVGSVKGDIHQVIQALELDTCFIGGHPMAGSEKTGLIHSTPYLLENAFYILTPANQVKQQQITEFYQFIASLGSVPVLLDHNHHDHATAAISHVPHIIASTLVNLVKKSDDPQETMKMLAAGGFKDITRIASSSPVMWEEICLSNQESILTITDSFIQELTRIRNTIKQQKKQEILDFFQQAKDYRDSLVLNNSMKTKTVFEFYCDLIDEAGGIATIATILATNHLSIKNIGIIHNREFEEGVLTIEMYEQTSYDKAIGLLTKHHYTIYER